MLVAGQVPLSQNRAGGAAGVYGDFAQTQSYHSVESGDSVHQGVIPMDHLASGPSKSAVSAGSVEGISCAVEDVTMEATQPVQTLEGIPPGRGCNQAMPASSMRMWNPNQASCEQPGLHAESQQKRYGSSTITGQSPESHARGSKLHVPASSPSTSHPSTASAVRQKSRLSMATNSSDMPPSKVPTNHARQPFLPGETEEGDGWNEDEVVWGKFASDGRGLEVCGTRAEIAELEASKELTAAVPGYLQQDLHIFSASIAMFPQYTGLNQVTSPWIYPVQDAEKLLLS